MQNDPNIQEQLTKSKKIFYILILGITFSCLILTMIGTNPIILIISFSASFFFMLLKIFFKNNDVINLKEKRTKRNKKSD